MARDHGRQFTRAAPIITIGLSEDAQIVGRKWWCHCQCIIDSWITECGMDDCLRSQQGGVGFPNSGFGIGIHPEGVRVNAIAPGIVPVERTVAALSDPAAQELWKPHLPVGRMGTVEEIGVATVQLCTNEWMSGTVLTVDGGMIARANMPFRPRPPAPSTSNDDSAQRISQKAAGQVIFHDTGTH